MDYDLSFGYLNASRHIQTASQLRNHRNSGLKKNVAPPFSPNASQFSGIVVAPLKYRIEPSGRIPL